MATNDVWRLDDLIDFINEAGDFYSPAFSDTLIANWINAGIQAWAQWVLKHDLTRFMKEGVIAISSGTDSYDLKDNAVLSADDFFLARGLAVADTGSPSGYTRLQKMEWSERHNYSYTSHKLGALWDVQGDDLIIWPKPTWSANALLEYVPLPAKLVNDSDTVDLRGNVDFIVSWVCVKLCAKDESRSMQWKDSLNDAKLDIRSASPQNKAHPRRMVSIFNRATKSIPRMRRDEV